MTQRAGRGPRRPLEGQPHPVFGIKTKLQLALFVLAGLTLVAGMVAWSAFSRIEDTVEHVTGRSLPSVATALRVAEQISRLTAAAPAIMASRSQEQRLETLGALRHEAGVLGDLMHELTSYGQTADQVAGLSALEAEFSRTLDALDAAVDARLRHAAEMRRLVAEVSAAHGRVLETIEPLVDDAVFDLVILGERTRPHHPC